MKRKDSEIKKHSFCLGNISVNNMKKPGLNRYVYDFSLDYSTFDTSNIININKYLMKKQRMFGLIKTMFIRLLTIIVSASNHIKCVLLSNQIQSTLISLHPSEYSQELHNYLVAVNLGRCAGGCNTLDDLSNKVCVPILTLACF